MCTLACDLYVYRHGSKLVCIDVCPDGLYEDWAELLVLLEYDLQRRIFLHP